MHERARHDRDIVVVGAGPVGLVTALLLADAGIRVTLVEKGAAPGDLPRAISLQDESFRTFEQLGIADALKDESLLDTGSRYFGLRDRLLLEARPVPSRLGHPAKTQFDQPVLEQLLWDRAVEHPTLVFLRGAEATALTQTPTGVTLTVDVDGAARTVDAQWLVGADGGRSFTRTAVGIDLVGATQPQRWIVIDLLNETQPLDPFAEFHCDGKRPYVLVPGVGGRLRIEFMLFDDEDADAMTTPERIRELVVPAFRPQLVAADVRRAAVYVAHQRIARTYRAGRVFLVGDAAHLMPPFAGQGLNAGVRDATNLAWKLIEAIAGRATARLLDSYDIERRAHGVEMVTVSRRIGAAVMTTNPITARIRDLAVRAVSLHPKARDHLANMRFISPADYSAGAAASRQQAQLVGVTVGRALSQPEVVGSDGGSAGLDTFLGRGWALVQVGGEEGALKTRHPYWDAIGATRLRVLPPGIEPGTGEVAELTPALTAGIPVEAVFVAVRPDRYVAAVFTAGEEARVVTELSTFVEAPRRSTGRPSPTPIPLEERR